MVRDLASIRFAYQCVCLAFAALELSTFLDPQCAASTTTSAQVPLLHSVAEVLPPLAALGVLLVPVALTYYRLSRRHAAGGPVAGTGNGRVSISGLVMFVLCVSAGTLELIVFGFGQAAGGGAEDHGAQARALGLAALRAMPTAATATFFCGMMTLIVAGAAHVRAGGEAGGTGAIAGDGPVQGLLLRVLPKVAAGMAAALVGLMAMAALTLYYGAKY